MNNLSSQLPTLETDRLILRPFEISDAQRVTDLLQDTRIHHCTQNIPYPYQLPMAYEWIAAHLIRFLQGTDIVLAITSKENLVLGTIGLQLDMRHLSGEMGYWIGAEHRKQGFCSEALRKMVSYAFHKIKLHRLHANYFEWNEASGKVLKNCGFRIEGVFRQAVRKQGVFQNLVQVALLEEEWKQNV